VPDGGEVVEPPVSRVRDAPVTEKQCRMPVIVRINGNDIPTQIWCVQTKGHDGPHAVPVSWPNEEIGIILDVTVGPEAPR
jgi:hypothetical protein